MNIFRPMACYKIHHLGHKIVRVLHNLFVFLNALFLVHCMINWPRLFRSTIQLYGYDPILEGQKAYLIYTIYII